MTGSIRNFEKLNFTPKSSVFCFSQGQTSKHDRLAQVNHAAGTRKSRWRLNSACLLLLVKNIPPLVFHWRSAMNPETGSSTQSPCCIHFSCLIYLRGRSSCAEGCLGQTYCSGFYLVHEFTSKIEEIFAKK